MNILPISGYEIPGKGLYFDTVCIHIGWSTALLMFQFGLRFEK